MGSHSNKFNSLRYSFVRVLFKQLIIKMMKIAVLAFALFAAVIAEPEAEASPDAYYGYGRYGRYGYGGYGYGGYGRGYGYGHYLGKRSAEPFYGYGYPFAYGAYPYALSAGPLLTSAGPTGIAGHGIGTSYTARSPQGLRGKRSAEPYFGYGGYYGRFPYAYGP